MSRVIRRIVLAFAVGLAALAVAPADAQTRAATEARHEAFQPDILLSDLAIFTEMLDLDETQQRALTDVFSVYDEAFVTGRAAVRDELRAMRPAPAAPDEAYVAKQREIRDRIAAILDDARARSAATDDADEKRRIMERARTEINAVREELADFGASSGEPEALNEMMEAFDRLTAEWMRKKRTLRDRFMADAAALLTDDQHAAWPALERRLRRTKSMHHVMLSGENVDLLRLLQRVSITPHTLPEGALRDLVTGYELQLDAALKQRESIDATLLADLDRAEAEGDDAAVRRLARRRVDAARRVRDLTLATIEPMAAELEAYAADLFRDTAYRRAVPRLFGPTRAERVLKGALAQRDLEPAVREAVEQLMAIHVVERAALRQQVLQVILTHEPDVARARLIADRPNVPTDVSAAAAAIDDAYRQIAGQEESVLRELRNTIGAAIYDRLPGALRVDDAGDARDGAERMRDRYLEMFDADGDGELNAAEREALAKHLRAERDRRDGGSR